MTSVSYSSFQSLPVPFYRFNSSSASSNPIYIHLHGYTYIRISHIVVMICELSHLLLKRAFLEKQTKTELLFILASPKNQCIFPIIYNHNYRLLQTDKVLFQYHLVIFKIIFRLFPNMLLHLFLHFSYCICIISSTPEMSIPYLYFKFSYIQISLTCFPF